MSSIDKKAFGLSDSLINAVNEALKGGQVKLDKNHNGKIDGQDFKMLRKEEVVDEGNPMNKEKKNAAVSAVGAKNKDSQYLTRINPSVADKIRGREKMSGNDRKQFEEVQVDEAGMPASVIKSKQNRANMTDKQFADSHKNHSDADLRSMAWRHGLGKPGTPGHDHYVNRRAKGLKEEAEQIDEISTKLAVNYAKGALKSMDTAAAKGSAGHDTFMKRSAGQKLALDKTNPEYKRLKAKVGTTDANAKDAAYKKTVGEDVEQVNELSTDTYHSAAKKAAKRAMGDVQGRSGPIFKKYAGMANKFRAKGMEQEKKERAMKEEALDELSPATMKSYVKKAGADKRDSEMKSKVYSKLANTLTSQSPKDAPDVRAQGHGHYVNAKKRGEGIKLAKKKLGEEVIDEVLTKSTTAGETISDFVHSKNPKFAGKSKEKRKEMALAAYYQKQRNEEVEILEDAHEIAKKYKDYVTGGGAPETASRYKSHVNMLSKKTGEHPDDINKQVRKHVKAMKEDVHSSSDIAKYKTNDTEEEIEMVRTELKAIANKTMHMLSNMPANHHIEPWIQAKIAAAKEMIGSVHDYMMYSEPEEDEQTDTPVTFPNMANDSAAGVNV